jgi:site-specific recombinase XerD
MRMIQLPWQVTRQMFLSEDEVDRLLGHLSQKAQRAESGAITEYVDEVIVRSLLFSGLRNSEFCRLTLADTFLGTRKSVFQVRGTPREDRDVVIPRRLNDLVRRFVVEIRPKCLREGASPRDLGLPLVVNERGRPYERTGLYRRVVRILTEADLEKRASVQLLRHTYGYLAYKRARGNLLFVQRQLGHAHPLVTSIYAQFVDESYSDLADGLAERLPGERSKRRSVRRKRSTSSKGE